MASGVQKEFLGFQTNTDCLEGDTDSPDLPVLGLKHCIPGDMSRLNPGKQASSGQ